MKSSISTWLSAACLLPAFSLWGEPPADADEPGRGSRIQSIPANDSYIFSWWGKTGETYFIQISPDLTGWEYIDEIYSGQDTLIEHGFSSNASSLFFRLRYTDEATSDPGNTDFDGDGISNIDELAQGTNPFLATDTDGDGIPDDWEIFYGLDPNDPSDGTADPDGDSLTNALEHALLRNPFEHENSPSGIPAKPENVVVHIHLDGSRTYTWSDVSDNEDYFFIEIRRSDGTMVRVADQIPPNTTSYTVSAAEIQAALQ